jgi:hypothetical protein
VSVRISVLLAALAVFLGVAATPAARPKLPAARPKLKDVGNVVVAYAQSQHPGADGLVAQWHTGLMFRNAPQVHSAVCVYDPAHDDYHVAGLHLTAAAARQLASDLTHAAGTHSAGGVEIVNHRNHRPNIWVTLRPHDAKVLSSEITAAAKGHAAT